MQTFNKISKVRAIFILFLLFAPFTFAESSSPSAPINPNAAPQMPQMPTITMPQMPSFSSPTTGNNFYKPGAQNNQNAQNKKQTSLQNQEQKTQSAADSTIPKNLLENALQNITTYLTAADLNSLAKNGSITKLSDLLGKNKNALNKEQNQAVLLNQILLELKEIKNSQKDYITRPKVGTKPSSEPPTILRFTINSRDITSNLTNVYFSQCEVDGTFLLTGDAKSLVGNKPINETFYLLFKACGTENAKNVFVVTPSISQSFEFSTPLKSLCDFNNITASRIGNLVMLHTSQNSKTFDMLLDIGNIGNITTK